MERQELIDLVKEIINVKGKTEEQIDDLIQLLLKHVSYPQVTDLIYFEDLTPEEIIDKTLNYKPPTLPSNTDLSESDF